MRVKKFLPLLLGSFFLVYGGRGVLEKHQSLKAGLVPEDSASIWEPRMRAVMQALPPDIRTVGYLEAFDIDASAPGQDEAEFYLTQYGLAPVVVKAGSEDEWIVGNFGSSFVSAKTRGILDRVLDPYSIQDLGFGLYLIHRLEW